MSVRVIAVMLISEEDVLRLICVFLDTLSESFSRSTKH